MVKPDVTKDYYGTLEVAHDADTEEIKRAYRRLAMQWHPDRNRGNEVEASNRFQEISSAHDILIDEPARRKYDNDRARAAAKLHDLNSPPFGRPHMPARNTASTYAPPPQPPRKPHAAPPPSPKAFNGMKSPSSGATRYARFAADPTPWNHAPEQQKRGTAAYDFKAWDHMKAQSQQPRSSGPANTTASASADSARARPTRSNTFTNREAPTAAATAKARAGWDSTTDRAPPQAGLGRSNTTRAAPRKGFHPGTASGDEAPAPSTSAYAHLARAEKPGVSRPQTFTSPPPPPQPPRPNGPSNRQARPQRPNSNAFRSPGSDERLRTPYAAAGGEKTYFSSEGLSRTASHGSGLHTGWQDESTSPGDRTSPYGTDRHRSASPRMRSPRANAESDTSSSDSEEERRGPRIKLKPRGHGRAFATSRHPTQQPPSTFIPNAAAGPAPPGDQDYLRRQSVPSRTPEELHGPATANLGPMPTQTGSGRRTSAGDVRAHSTHVQHGPRRSPAQNDSPSASDDARPRPMEKARSFESKQAASTGPHVRSGPSPLGGPAAHETSSPFRRVPSGVASPGRASSVDNLSAQFSQANWHDKFGNAAEHLAPQHSGPKARSPASPPLSRPTSLGHYASPPPAGVNGHPPPEAAGGMANAAKAVPTKFSKEEWDAQFRESTWAFPTSMTSPRNAPARPVTKGRGRLNSAARRGPKPRPAVLSATDSEDSDLEIDPSMASRPASNGSRGSGSAMDLDPKSTPPGERPTPSHPAQAIPTIRTTAPQARPAAVSEGETPFNLNDLRQTAPFSPTRAGLGGMSDLHTHLPFESSASGSPATSPSGTGTGTGVALHRAPMRLALPSPPKAPPAPNKDRLTQHDWESYCRLLRAYLAEWNTFNRRMLAHFNARQARVETELHDTWLTTRGNDGFLKYMAGLDEDVRVREHWDVSWERHRTAMQTYGAVRKVALLGHFCK